MVIGLHFIFSAYGFWLPNDPRGSWSETIRQYELLRFGPATKVDTTRSVAHVPHDRRLREEAKRALMYEPVRFTGLQARAIYRGFMVAASEHPYRFEALAILPDHIHLLMHNHERDYKRIAAHLKAKATHRLNAEGLHPLAEHPRADGTLPSPFARNEWCPFIRRPDHFGAARRYVNANPRKSGLPDQNWRGIPAPA